MHWCHCQTEEHFPSGIIVEAPAPLHCKMSYVKWMRRPTWHKVRFWRFCSQSVWTWNIFYTFLPPNKESWTKKCGENDPAKIFIDIFSVRWSDGVSSGMAWPHSTPCTACCSTTGMGTVYNYQLPAFFSNYSWQKLPVLVSDGLRTGVSLECCLFIFFTIYNSFWQC